MIKKSTLGPHGEHLLADTKGMIATEGDTIDTMNFAVHPASSESPIIYRDWDHYVAVCVTAATRAANATKVAAEDAAAR